MDKTARSEFYRLFLIENLPEPLTVASQHLQLFDDYIDGTRLRIRRIREPYENKWTHTLQQISKTSTPVEIKLTEMYLNDQEYSVLAPLTGAEIRKNRYFHEYDRVMMAFDVFLGPQKGLMLARAEFDSATAAERFEIPHFAAIDVTGDPSFLGENLAYKSFSEVRRAVGSLLNERPNPSSGM